jgi:hypothetical protein
MNDGKESGAPYVPCTFMNDGRGPSVRTMNVKRNSSIWHMALPLGINSDPGEAKNQLLTQPHLINTSSSSSSSLVSQTLSLSKSRAIYPHCGQVLMLDT